MYYISIAVYTLIIILATPSLFVWYYKVSFWAFSIFLFWALIFSNEKAEFTKKFVNIGLWGILLVLFVTRIMPFLHWGEAPLGYDTGIYLRNFGQILVDSTTQPLDFIVHILSAIGFSVNAMVHGFSVVFNILLGLSIYFATKGIFRSRPVALSALLLFTLSIAQYEAYIWMFYRMMLALVLVMITIGLTSRRSYLSILTGGFAGALHPATFLIFGLSYAIYIVSLVFYNIKNKLSLKEGHVKYAVLSGLGILILSLVLNWSEFIGYLPYLIEHKLQLSNFSTALSSELTGLYLNFTAFRGSTLFYIPFAILGVINILSKYKKRSKEDNINGFLLLLAFLSVTILLIGAKVIFYQRYLIILGLIIIILASISFAQLIQYFKNSRSGRILISILIIGFVGVTLMYSFMRTPWIPSQELQELKSISLKIDNSAYAMATDAFYTPWVYGYATDKTIAPGYFINYWSYDEWVDFWGKGSDSDRIKLLEVYNGKNIYIFVGSKQLEYKGMIDFLNNYATKISEHVWLYQSL